VPERAGIRTLVVDDDPDFLATMRTILSLDERVDLVAEASDGSQAVELVDELAPDVVAMDVLMPGMGGLEAARRIHARRPDCRVVLVSGSIFAEGSGGQPLELAREAGAAAYVPKSRAVLDLADAVVAAARIPATS
jgi:two-component system invasion response regulator UvrY